MWRAICVEAEQKNELFQTEYLYLVVTQKYRLPKTNNSNEMK